MVTGFDEAPQQIDMLTATDRREKERVRATATACAAKGISTIDAESHPLQEVISRWAFRGY